MNEMDYLMFGAFSYKEEEMPPHLWQYAVRQYNEAWDAYIEAGCPFGEQDEAMLIWFEFEQHTREN